MEKRAQQNTYFLDQSWKYILKRLLSTTVEDFINRKTHLPFFPSSCHSSAYYTMLASAANRWIGKKILLITSVWGYGLVNHDRYDLSCSQHNDNASVTCSFDLVSKLTQSDHYSICEVCFQCFQQLSRARLKIAYGGLRDFHITTFIWVQGIIVVVLNHPGLTCRHPGF